MAIEVLEPRLLLTTFGHQTLYDGEPGSAPLIDDSCVEHFIESPDGGVDRGTALQTVHTGFHDPVYSLFCQGEPRRDFTPYDRSSSRFEVRQLTQAMSKFGSTTSKTRADGFVS
ncbi:MAG: hypothetical protein CMJ78_03535 [Planctomycetaceae bacterium]|nr:hypothetical protein [Planctomycetaceae bacterium]